MNVDARHWDGLLDLLDLCHLQWSQGEIQTCDVSRIRPITDQNHLDHTVTRLRNLSRQIGYEILAWQEDTGSPTATLSYLWIMDRQGLARMVLAHLGRISARHEYTTPTRRRRA